MRYRAVLGMIAGVGLLAACGGADLGVESSGAAVAPTLTTAPPTTQAPPTSRPRVTSTEPTVTDTAVVDTAVITTPDGGVVFVDPEGLYSMTIGRTWDELGVMRGAQAWTIGGSGGFGASVNILVQPYTLGLPQLVDTGLVGADMIIDDLEVIQQTVTTGAQGQPIGVVEYTGTLGAKQFHFLCVAVVTPDNAVLATFAAGADGFESVRAEVEPFLRTLAILD